MEKYLFTSEAVSEGHPDKVADQISDAILDEFLRLDKNARVAVETLVTTQFVVISGEVSSTAEIDYEKVIRNTIKKIGYIEEHTGFTYDKVEIVNKVHRQSPDIARGVDKEDQGAGDQGIMFGYATNETSDYMPVTLYVANKIMKELAHIRHMNSLATYLLPDSKSQVTMVYENDKPVSIDSIVVSTQHRDFGNDEEMYKVINDWVRYILIPIVADNIDNKFRKMLLSDKVKFLVNPTGKFVVGGPDGDTGLTGRKIIVDTYGGWGAHGGGAFSGKDPSKVDRSAAYMARYIAKNMVAAGVSDRMLIQISYAIGVSSPMSIYVNTYGTNNTNMSDGDIASYIADNFDLRPKAIIDTLCLKSPIYEETSRYGHFGRHPFSEYGVEYFTWEKLNRVEGIKSDLL